ncbi:hypothetical protein ES708_29419 [subsurface metagenome]
MGITYVKSNELEAASMIPESVEVDLGLAIDEAARILGIELSVMPSGTPQAGDNRGEAVVSFDPEDTAIDYSDDEQFAILISNVSFVGATAAAQSSQNIWLDYTGLNLITSRNLRFIVMGAVTAAKGKCRVFYEKYKPSVSDLNQLIAQRR